MYNFYAQSSYWGNPQIRPSAHPHSIRHVHVYAVQTMAHHEAFDAGWIKTGKLGVRCQEDRQRNRNSFLLSGAIPVTMHDAIVTGIHTIVHAHDVHVLQYRLINSQSLDYLCHSILGVHQRKCTMCGFKPILPNRTRKGRVRSRWLKIVLVLINSSVW